jgi:hypothetical protein
VTAREKRQRQWDTAPLLLQGRQAVGGRVQQVAGYMVAGLQVAPQLPCCAQTAAVGGKLCPQPSAGIHNLHVRWVSFPAVLLPTSTCEHDGPRRCTCPPPTQGDHAAFAAYLAKYRNTICGRHPIGVLLAVSSHWGSRARSMPLHRLVTAAPCLPAWNPRLPVRHSASCEQRAVHKQGPHAWHCCAAACYAVARRCWSIAAHASASSSPRTTSPARP